MIHVPVLMAAVLGAAGVAWPMASAAPVAPSPAEAKALWEGGTWTADIGGEGWLSGYRSLADYLNPAFKPPNPPPLNAAAETVRAGIRDQVAKGEKGFTPYADCHPAGMPYALATGGQAGYTVVVGHDEILMLMGDWDYRRIYMDGRAHPDGPQTYSGDSVGHWEGRTLVIDTVNIRGDNAQIEPYTPKADGSHIVERYTPTAPGRMDVGMTMTNPQFTRPWVVAFHLNHHPAGKVAERICTDKNKTRGDYLDEIKN